MQPSSIGEIKETISSLILLDNVKIENKVDCSSPFEKFVSFIKYYSDFDCLIRSLCHVFRVVKACLMKENKEKKAIF